MFAFSQLPKVITPSQEPGESSTAPRASWADLSEPNFPRSVRPLAL